MSWWSNMFLLRSCRDYTVFFAYFFLHFFVHEPIGLPKPQQRVAPLPRTSELVLISTPGSVVIPITSPQQYSTENGLIWSKNVPFHLWGQTTCIVNIILPICDRFCWTASNYNDVSRLVHWPMYWICSRQTFVSIRDMPVSCTRGHHVCNPSRATTFWRQTKGSVCTRGTGFKSLLIFSLNYFNGNVLCAKVNPRLFHTELINHISYWMIPCPHAHRRYVMNGLHV